MTFVHAREIDELGWSSDQRTQDIINDIVLQFADQPGPRVFVGRLLWEILRPTQNLEVLIHALEKQNIQTILLVNEAQSQDQWIHSVSSKCTDIMFFDFFLYSTYQETILKNHNDCNTSWNSQATKFLYLTGAPRRERLRLFYKLYQIDMLPRMTWSLIIPDNKDTIDPTWIPEIPLDQVYNFFKKYEGTADGMEPVCYPDGHKTVRNSLKYDKELWKNARFRLITESESFEMYPKNPLFRVTEKTWITMANKLPFLMLSKPQLLKKLKEKNFKTFEEYTKVTNYDSIRDTENRIDALIENVCFWMSHDMPVEQIRSDIEHNYQLLLTQGQYIEQQILKLIKKHKLNLAVEQLVPTSHNLNF